MSLTSDRNAAEMSAALAMLHPWLALARGSGRNPDSRALSHYSRATLVGNISLMKTSTPKKRMGRPPTGRMHQTALALPKQLLDGLDKLARQQGVTRGEIMRQLLAEALEARKKS
jgi:hypothetical protein